MAFNAATLLQERQCAPIYNALDSGNASLALKQCNGLLASQPDLHLATALKALALLRLGRKREASNLADGLVKLQAGVRGPVVLTPLCMVLSSLDRGEDELEVLEAASKASPNSLELGTKAFLAMIKTKQWQRAQQTSLRLHKMVSIKNKKADDYFWSSMQAYSLIAGEDSLPGYQLALPLATRMIAKHLESHPIGPKSDEIMFLYASILRKQGSNHVQEALRLLGGEERGRELCKRSMTLAALRYELLEEVGDWKTIYTEAMSALESGDRNWSRVQEAVQASVHLVTSEESFSLFDIEDRLAGLARSNGSDRTLQLAPLHLIKEVHQGQDSSRCLQKSAILDRFTAYLEKFSTKACAYEDLVPFVPLLTTQETQTALQFLQTRTRPPPNGKFDDLGSMYRNLNACKLSRLMQSLEDITADSEHALGQSYFSLYLCALSIGKDLPKTEMQPADDYALLSAQTLIHASVLQREAGQAEAPATLQLAIAVLTSALRYSPKGYRLRVLLIRLLRQCGAVDLARAEYEEIGVKAIQHDTLGWILSSRASLTGMLLPPGSKQEGTFAADVKRLQAVWREARMQVPQMVCRSFEKGIFSRVEEIVDFGQRLENSLAKYLVAIESARSTALQAVSGTESKIKLVAEVGECDEAIRKTRVSDQQDYRVLLDLMPSAARPIGALTATAGTGEPGLAYLRAMLPVAMIHLDTEAAPSEAEVQTDELSSEEASLSTLARALAGQDHTAVTPAALQLFDIARQAIKNHRPSDAACSALHCGAVACEAAHLLTSVWQRRGEGAKWDATALHSSFSSLLDTFKAASWGEPLPTPSSSWCALLDQLPLPLREGLSGEVLLKRKEEQLRTARQEASSALEERLQSALTALPS